MPKLSPLDDNQTYLTIAQQQYRNAALNPKAVNASREQTAGTSSPQVSSAQPASQTDPKTGISFNKTFTPQERAAQKAALADKLKQMDAEDAASSGEK